MPKRMHPKERLRLLRMVVIRDGDRCILCGEEPVKDKTLDHLDNNSNNNHPDNISLLCRACNTSERNRRNRFLTRENIEEFRMRRSQVGVSVGEGGHGRAVGATQEALMEIERSMAKYSRLGYQSTEEAANLMMEPKYRKWLFDRVKKVGAITKHDAVYAGAEFLDRTVGRGSPTTTDRYFNKIVSSLGWLTETMDLFGRPAWGFSKGVNLPDLEASLDSRIAKAEGIQNVHPQA